jgi:hypothetical protein
MVFGNIRCLDEAKDEREMGVMLWSPSARRYRARQGRSTWLPISVGPRWVTVAGQRRTRTGFVFAPAVISDYQTVLGVANVMAETSFFFLAIHS